jgi:subtilase family serine protease
VKGVSLNGVSLSCPPKTCDDSEQVLDIEMAISMAPGLKQVVVYVGNSDVSIFNQMAVDNTSKQLSCSWGWSDDESSLDPIFKEMATQGQSVFVATGDNGSGTPGDVVWPADDPYITAVGGTDLTTAGPGGAWQSETGWSGSAGSPSKNKVPIPTYQKLPGVINSLNHGSKTLRNYPDVAAEANTNQYSCYDGGCSGGNGGTSYAAPQWAGLTAMANQQAVAAGGTTLGFLNPFLYGIGIGSGYDSDFHDITSGSNGGYSAVTGYDLVTGWGSPNGANLINALAAAKDE